MSQRKTRQSIARRRRYQRSLLEVLESRILLTAQPTVWTPLGVGLGGTCYYANMNPANPNEMYLQTDMGEVWHTLDSGLHWATLNMQNQLSSNANADSVWYTSNPSVQYAISGKSTPKVSKDGGQTWNTLGDWARIKAQDGGSASHLVVDPNSTNRVILIEQSGSSTFKWWVYYSTDGGNTFTPINTNGAGGVADTTNTDTAEPWVAGAFWDGNNIYFATFKGLYKSIDGGANWTYTSSSALSKPNNANGFNVNAGQTYSRIVSFTGSKAGGVTRLWAIAWNGSVNTVSASTQGFTNYSGLYSSDDGGATWTNRDGATFGASGSGKILTPRWVQTADNDVNDVWIGGGDSANSTAIVYKSANGGLAWNRLLFTGADTANFPESPNQNVYTRAYGKGGDYDWGYIGPGTVTFIVDRANPNYITFTGMGTLFGTIDGGANWYDIGAGGPGQLPNSAWNPKGTAITRGTAYSNSQANETSAWDLTFIDPNTFFIDDTDVAGQRTTDGGQTWGYLTVPGKSNPNTFYQSVYVPQTDTLYAVTSDKHDIWTNNIDDGQIEQFGSNYLVKSTDHGATWSILHTFPTAAPARVLAIDPNNINTLYVGTVNHNYGSGGIWKTTDLQDGASSAWTYLTNQPSRDVDNNGSQDFAGKYPSQLTVLNDGTLIAVYAVRLAFSPEYLSPNSLSYTSGVWVSTDGGTSWRDRSSKDGLGDDLYNFGKDMYNTTGNLLPTETFSVTVDPNDSTQNTWFATTYYFGTQPYGTIYKTTDRGQHWSVWMDMASGSSAPNRVGQAENMWIQPGGKLAIVTTKNGLYYCPDYTAATPEFFNVENFPFNGNPSFKIVSDPFNSNRIYVTTFGDGVWTADISQLGAAGVVSNLSAKTMSGTEVQLNWTITAPTGTGYVVEKSTDQNTWTTAATSASWRDTSVLVTGLNPGTKYYFRVRTTNAGGNSLPSKIVTAYTDGAGLIAYDGFSATTGNLNGFDGTADGTGWNGAWSAGSNTTLITDSVTPAAPPDQAGAGAVQLSNTSSTNASRLLNTTIGTPGSVVWVGFEINSSANGGMLLLGDTTNGLGFGTFTYTTWPNFYSYSNGVGTYRQSNQSWTGSTHFVAGRLEFRDDNTVYVQMFLDPTPGLIYANNPVTSWQNSWNAILPNPFGASGSNKITLTRPTASGTAKFDEIRIGGTYLSVAPKASTPSPGAPSAVNATVASPNQVDLTWTNNANNQQGFTVEELVGATWTPIAKLYNTAAVGSQISYSVTNLSPSTAYQFRVSAFNSAGSSSTALSQALTTLPAAPAPVNNLAVTVSNGQFNLTWSDAANESGYVLQYANGSVIRSPYNDGELAWTTVAPNLAANSIGTSLTGLAPNAGYYFRIYAINSGGTSTCSNVVGATGFAAPIGVSAAGISDTQAEVYWTDNFPTESGYNIQYSTDGINWTNGGSAPANATQYAAAGLAPDTVYQFRVQAFALGSTGSWSTACMARTFSTLPGQIAYDGFSDPVGGGASWAAQNSGTGWTSPWTVSDPNLTGIFANSLPYGSGPTALNETGNSAWTWQSNNASRGINYTFGQDDTSLWIGFVVRQHADGGAATLYGGVQLGSDPNNLIHLASWNGGINADLYINGARYYMQTGTGSVTDNAVNFLVYRIDFGQQANNQSPDVIRVWLNPTPGTQPTDASANASFTLPAGKYLNLDSTVRLFGSSYYNRTTVDELRLGTTYVSVAPVALPAIPTSLDASGAPGAVALNWTDTSNNESGFHVERSTDGVNFSVVKTLGPGVSSWTDTPLAAGTYYYRVSSYNPTGDSLYSNSAGAVATASDIVPPQVTAVYVGSSTWTPAFLNELASDGFGSATLGYRIPTGQAQTTNLDWSGIDKITIVFSENVNASQAQLALTGAHVPAYAFSNFNLSGNAATWTLTQPIDNDNLQLNLSSAVTDTAGNNLDGEWTDNVSTTSGNGSAGGNFIFHFNVLPGDVDGNSAVNFADFVLLSNNYGQPNVPMLDFNGDASVNFADFVVLSNHYGLSNVAPSSFIATTAFSAGTTSSTPTDTTTAVTTTPVTTVQASSPIVIPKQYEPHVTGLLDPKAKKTLKGKGLKIEIAAVAPEI